MGIIGRGDRRLDDLPGKGWMDLSPIAMKRQLGATVMVGQNP
jgi:hypothetical protein